VDMDKGSVDQQAKQLNNIMAEHRKKRTVLQFKVQKSENAIDRCASLQRKQGALLVRRC
jgi:hypothetical protein